MTLLRLIWATADAEQGGAKLRSGLTTKLA